MGSTQEMRTCNSVVINTDNKKPLEIPVCSDNNRGLLLCIVPSPNMYPSRFHTLTLCSLGSLWPTYIHFTWWPDSNIEVFYSILIFAYPYPMTWYTLEIQLKYGTHLFTFMLSLREKGPIPDSFLIICLKFYPESTFFPFVSSEWHFHSCFK